MTQQTTPELPKSSPAVLRAMSRFWTRLAENSTDPAERERYCARALRLLNDAKDARDAG